ncbi:MAG: endonuclease V [Planctomycetes bacterium]|nr:endonuclease V [Planctomycetota bacterium]
MTPESTLHSWSVTPKQAVTIQRELAPRIIRRGRPRHPNLLAGVDLAFLSDPKQSVSRPCRCVAGVVVWDVEAQAVVEQHVVRRAVRFPYVPGLLSFREAPAILAVLRKLRCAPDAFLFDGQGFAHPRRFGLACHVGLLIDRPSLGCAKSLLIGTCRTPGVKKGSTSPIEHHGERIGVALRTRDRVKPIYVSIGHRLSLESAVEIALRACTRYRIPEPTRLADKLVAEAKRSI